MVGFLFTEDNTSVDSEEQSSEYFYDVSTSNMLNNSTFKSIVIHEYQHRLTRVNTNQHESDTSQHESTQVKKCPR